MRPVHEELASMKHVLENLLIAAENIVKSNPLTHLTVTVDQGALLTPKDLLNGVIICRTYPDTMESS